mmetsp:Transcript_66355/g.128313  ORF Transcript_66355/g.128313 Transcript_66355/m.128313 type:complete len:433 (+) Transcript_66355:157-1455(+)
MKKKTSEQGDETSPLESKEFGAVTKHLGFCHHASWECASKRCSLTRGWYRKNRRINSRAVKGRLVIVMPNGVTNAGGITLVSWALPTFALLDWLAVEGREVPEISHRLVDTTQEIILDLALVMHTIEGSLPHIFESVPESTLGRCKSFSKVATRLRDAALALILCVEVGSRLAGGKQCCSWTGTDALSFVNAIWNLAISMRNLSHAVHARPARRSPRAADSAIFPTTGARTWRGWRWWRRWRWARSWWRRTCSKHQVNTRTVQPGRLPSARRVRKLLCSLLLTPPNFHVSSAFIGTSSPPEWISTMGLGLVMKFLWPIRPLVRAGAATCRHRMACLARCGSGIGLVASLLLVIHRQAWQRLALPRFLPCFRDVVGPHHHNFMAFCMAQCCGITLQLVCPTPLIFSKCCETLGTRIRVTFVHLLKLSREQWPH